jgi:5-methylcytosine-specific restriction protein A
MPPPNGKNPNWTRDETILVLDLLERSRRKAPAKTSAQVKELSEFLRAYAVHPLNARNAEFRDPDGVYRKMHNLLSCDLPIGKKGLKTSKMDRAVWAEFIDGDKSTQTEARRIRASATALKSLESLEEADDDEEVTEGSMSEKVHRRRDRARGLRPKVLNRHRKANGGKLHCDCCSAKERKRLGAVAEAEFEAHHKVPLASDAGKTKTKVSDLVVLCANCHRLIHALMRRRNAHVTIAELRAALNGASA